MKQKKAVVIYFSPTGTTEKVLKNIIAGMNVENVEYINATHKAVREKKVVISEGDFLLIGSPVYSDRLPGIFEDFLKNISLKSNLSVVVAVYGNRAAGTVCRELYDIVSSKDGCVIGAAEFVGEHSFSVPAIPIAQGRPDLDDLSKAKTFGIGLNKVMQEVNILSFTSADQLGKSEYRKRADLGVEPPEVNELCNSCGACISVCPVGIIDVDGYNKTNSCLACCACIKVCPSNARSFSGKIEEIAVRLHNNCNERLEPIIKYPGTE